MISSLFSPKKKDKALLEAYNLAVSEHANRVCAYASKLVKDTNFAKDLTQDAYIKLWKHRKEIDFDKVKSWLFTTTYRLCIDHLRKKSIVVLGTENNTEPWTTPENCDVKEIIQDAMERLNEVQKSILLLRDYEGYDYKEIGNIMELNESQVKVYLFRARKAMKTYIGTPETIIG